MQVITSKDNEIIKNIKKLKEKKYRDQTGIYNRTNKTSTRSN